MDAKSLEELVAFWKKQIVQSCALDWKGFTPEERREFSTWHYDTNLRYLQIALLGSTLLTFAVSLYGFLILDEANRTLMSRWPQLVFLALQVITLRALKSKFMRAHHQEVIALLVILSFGLVTNVIVNLIGSRALIGYGAVFSMLLFNYGLMRLSTLHATIAGLTGCVWFIYQASTSPMFSHGSLMQISGYLVNFNAFGMILAYTLDRVHRQNFVALKRVSREFERAESLLLNILPAEIATRLKADHSSIADHIPEVTVLFADIVDFTTLAKSLPPEKVVTILNDLFTEFDAVMERHGVEKIKTIGDAYMAASGLLGGHDNHAERAANAALDLLDATKAVSLRLGYPLQVRIGLNSGAVVAGVIGRKKMIYDLWGDTVNIASRMESGGQPSRIQVSLKTWELLRNHYEFEEPKSQNVKGHGEMQIRIFCERVGKKAAA